MSAPDQTNASLVYGESKYASTSGLSFAISAKHSSILSAIMGSRRASEKPTIS